METSTTTFPTITSVADVGAPDEIVWTKPEDAVSSNDAWATAALNAQTLQPFKSEILRCTGAVWVPTIPADATLTGLSVFIEGNSTPGVSADAIIYLLVQLWDGLLVLGTDQSTGEVLAGGTDTETRFGGPGKLWGGPIDRADIVAAGWAVNVIMSIAAGSDTLTAKIDNVRAVAHYSLAPPADPPTQQDPLIPKVIRARNLPSSLRMR